LAEPAAGNAAAAAGAMLVMGRVTGPFAVSGWVKLQVFTERVDGLLDYPVWWIGQQGDWQQFEVEQGAAHGGSLLAKLKGVQDREQAAALRGREVAVPREALPGSAEGEYYWADLAGLRVANLEGEALGVVTGLLETGANQVLVVHGERERLIPFVAAVVKSVDVARGALVVDWGADF
jgi:16S rRNA processing protein RimM